MATYKAVMRPALEYASSIWSPLASSTSINKLRIMQNAALRTATGCTQDTNIYITKDSTLPIHEHLQLYASQYKQKTKTSITSPTQTHNILQHSKAKTHYFQQWPLHNKHSHRPPHSHYNRQVILPRNVQLWKKRPFCNYTVLCLSCIAVICYIASFLVRADIELSESVYFLSWKNIFLQTN